MTLKFDDPNCLIDDSTPVTDEISNQEQANVIKIRDLNFGKDIENLVKPSNWEDIRFINSSCRREKDKLFIETFAVEDFRYPDPVKEIFVQINQLSYLPINCKNVNGVGLLKCDWEKPKRNHHNPKNEREKIDEIEKYIRAARYLLEMLRRERREIVVVEPVQQERFAKFKKNYRIQTLWIEHYLLGNNEVLIELGEKKPPTERQYRPGKVSAMLHKVIKDIWTLAENKKHPSCQWILSFDCPSQVWLILEAILIIQEWETPIQRGLPLYQLEMFHRKLFKELTKKYYEKITEDLLDFYNTKKTLFLDEALTFTFNQLRASEVQLPNFEDYLNARTGHANQARKGEKGKRSK